MNRAIRRVAGIRVSEQTIDRTGARNTPTTNPEPKQRQRVQRWQLRLCRGLRKLQWPSDRGGELDSCYEQWRLV